MKQRRRGRASRGQGRAVCWTKRTQPVPRADGALTAATMGKRYVVLCLVQEQCWGGRYTSNGIGSGTERSRYLHVLLERAPCTRTYRGSRQGVCALASQCCRSTARDVPVAGKKEKEWRLKRGQGCESSSTVASWSIYQSGEMEICIEDGGVGLLRYVLLFFFSPAVLRLMSTPFL